MGWSRGVNVNGRECGYGVDDVCGHPGCEVEIDRGISYTCGGLGDYGCHEWYCTDHLYYAGFGNEAICDDCIAIEQAALVEGMTDEEVAFLEALDQALFEAEMKETRGGD